MMKLKELASVLYSTRCQIETCIVYDTLKDTDLENGCSVEYAMKVYGNSYIERITSAENKLVLCIK